jgi:hypothetical protein
MFSIPRACQSAESVPKEQKVMLVSLKSKTQCERSRAVLRLSALNGRFPGDESGRIACCPGEIGEVPAPPKDVNREIPSTHFYQINSITASQRRKATEEATAGIVTQRI